MINLDLLEAQLLRMLSGFFGRENVIPMMSVLSVCGGELPKDYIIEGVDLHSWASRNKCLFTIVDKQDCPKAVFEFYSGINGQAIETDHVEHQQYLKPLLRSLGIHYITISKDEFSEMLDPRGELDFVSFLKNEMQIDED
ncbi:MAG: hypothetical protein GYA55_04895 [SAR324 cluster bacterium]|uniref:DUF2726 domain-containing protein n=1 Tax=SAR324 cluster bacterium TaxID=2024889 RepID=A0A7X9IJU9_9DELT|nr:hypothetical protein [SAR324 cluster bacterium]